MQVDDTACQLGAPADGDFPIACGDSCPFLLSGSGPEGKFIWNVDLQFGMIRSATLLIRAADDSERYSEAKTRVSLAHAALLGVVQCERRRPPQPMATYSIASPVITWSTDACF